MSSCRKGVIRHLEDLTSIVLGAVLPRGQTVYHVIHGILHGSSLLSAIQSQQCHDQKMRNIQ
jgi:hypothetical protein